MDWSESGYLALSALNVKDGYIDFTQDIHYGNQDLYAYIGVTEHVIALNGTLVAESGTGTEGGARFIQVQFLWVFFLRLSPLNSSRYALWQIRSRKASAKVAS